MEINAYRSYSEKDFSIKYWRTKTGLEVDFILDNGKIAVEIKSGRLVRQSDMQAINAFVEEYKPKAAYVVCNESAERKMGKLNIIPWKKFLQALWSGEIV